jgi:hypothetical protein
MKHFARIILFLIANSQFNPLFSQNVLISKTPIPKSLKNIDTIALVPESFKLNRPNYKGSITYLLELINPTKDTIKYAGYSFSYPWYRFQVMDSIGRYIEIDQGWFCGTGLRTCKVPPGMCAEIFMNKYKWKSRIGITYFVNSDTIKHTVWTRLIDKIKFE